MTDETQEVFERTEKLLAYAEALRLSVKQVEFDLSANIASLREELAMLRILMDGSARPAAPDPVLEEEPAKPDKKARPENIKERRAWPRRDDSRVLVFVADVNDASAPVQGWVVDRSAGGCCLLVETSAKEGDVLSVRPVDANPNYRWVKVQVRNCRKDKDGWKLGCKFVDKLDPKHIRQFG